MARGTLLQPDVTTGKVRLFRFPEEDDRSDMHPFEIRRKDLCITPGSQAGLGIWRLERPTFGRETFCHFVCVSSLPTLYACAKSSPREWYAFVFPAMYTMGFNL